MPPVFINLTIPQKSAENNSFSVELAKLYVDTGLSDFS